MISGRTRVIAHLGVPTETFKAPMIYNPYFEASGIDAIVVPMGCRPEHYPTFLRLFFELTNAHGALVTMPHKGTTVGIVDEMSTAARIAGACNAVRRRPDGKLVGDMFDGEGFVRGMRRKGVDPAGRRAMIVGAGGVGSAIAASLAGAGIGTLAISDADPERAAALCRRLVENHPALSIAPGTTDPAGFDIAVNATPLGMKDGDPLPFDVARLADTTFVGEVVMKSEMTPLLRAAAARGCGYQVGLDMLFEQIPAYLEFFGYPAVTPERLRELATIEY
jgi:shikimate dehydrogenase